MVARLTYKSAGVDIDLKERLIPLFGRIAKSTKGPHVLEGIGGFGAIIGLDGATKMKGTCDYGEGAGKGTFTATKN